MTGNNARTLISQCVPVPGAVPEPERGFRRRSGAARSPGTHIRRRKRPMHSGNGGGLQRHKQVRTFHTGTLKHRSHSQPRVNTTPLPSPHQRDAPGLPVHGETGRWLLCDACGWGGGRQVSFSALVSWLCCHDDGVFPRA